MLVMDPVHGQREVLDYVIEAIVELFFAMVFAWCIQYFQIALERERYAANHARPVHSTQNQH